jgi:hypothetical protein
MLNVCAVASKASRRFTQAWSERVARLRLRGSTPADRAHSAAFVFSGGADQLYQLHQWLATLQRLQPRLLERFDLGLVILVRSADVALRLGRMDLGGLQVVLATKSASVVEQLEAPGCLIALYPNQATLNFQALAASRPAHVHLSHGESEKVSMVSNQLKAYDCVFTAGEAARERILSHLVDFNAAAFVDVGRPQLDDLRVAPEWLPPTDKSTVLYAPTWEGDTPEMAYSSLALAGETIVRQLVEAGHRVIYRPHPQTGTRSDAAASAHRSIVAQLKSAGAEHVVDQGAEVGWQWDEADSFVLDVSAMAYDATTVGKPMAVVFPPSASAAVLAGGILSRVVTIDPGNPRAAEALAQADEPSARAACAEIARHHFGDVSPGVQTERFISAVLSVAEKREQRLGEGRSGFGPSA